MATKPHSKRKLEVDRNQIESIDDLRKETTRILKNDVLEKSVTTAWEQILGISGKKTHQTEGELAEGQELVFEQKEVRVEAQPAIEYAREIIHAGEITTRRENQEVRAKIEEITIELKKISESSNVLEATIKDVNIDMLPETPGKYHLNFFEWLLSTLQVARVRVENSANWATSVVGKRAKKDFWSNVRKHGTQYQLSSERVVSQQVG